MWLSLANLHTQFSPNVFEVCTSTVKCLSLFGDEYISSAQSRQVTFSPSRLQWSLQGAIMHIISVALSSSAFTQLQWIASETKTLLRSKTKIKRCTVQMNSWTRFVSCSLVICIQGWRAYSNTTFFTIPPYPQFCQPSFPTGPADLCLQMVFKLNLPALWHFSQVPVGVFREDRKLAVTAQALEGLCVFV